MKEFATEIKQAYYNRLNDVISVPVFDQVPRDYKGNYVLFQGVTGFTGQAETKCSRGYDISVTLQVVTRFEGNQGGYHLAESISGELIPLIGTRGNYITTTSFQVVTTTLGAVNELYVPFETGAIYKRIITFNHQIKEI